SGSSSGCQASGATVTCPIGDIPSNSEVDAVVRAMAGGPAGTAVARGSARGVEVAPGDDVVTMAVAETTLAITTAAAGVTVSNSGRLTARRVVVEDRLPAGAALVNGPPCGAPAEAGGLVVCDVGDLDPGAAFTLSWAGGSGVNQFEAKGDNTTRAAADGASVSQHGPATT